MIDISEELAVINTSKVGSEVKEAIYEALRKVSEADPNKYVGYDITASLEFAWGNAPIVTIGIAEEVDV